MNNLSGDIKSIMAQIKKGNTPNADSPKGEIPQETKGVTSKDLKDPEKGNLDETPLIEKKVSPRKKKEKAVQGTGDKVERPAIIDEITSFENSGSNNMLHIRVTNDAFDQLNQLKVCAKLDMTKIIGFAIADLFKNYPELDELIINNLRNKYKL